MPTDDLQVLETKLAVFTEKVSNWMDTTTEYRKQLCHKVDAINDKLALLPCAERKGWYQSMSRQIKFLWMITGAAVVGVIIEWAKKR